MHEHAAMGDVMRLRRTHDLGLVAALNAKTVDVDIEEVDLYGSAWWLLWDGARPAGFCGGRADVDSGHVYLCTSGVLATYRGHRYQGRMIRARLAWARRKGLERAITYTMPENPASGNSLIRAGFRLYCPTWAWAGDDVLYWFKTVLPGKNPQVGAPFGAGLH